MILDPTDGGRAFLQIPQGESGTDNVVPNSLRRATSAGAKTLHDQNKSHERSFWFSNPLTDSGPAPASD
jgi:hypothetical protein